MAKVTGPLNSFSATGSIAGITFSPRRGQNVVRIKVVPANPRTTAQVLTRNRFSAIGHISGRVSAAGLGIMGETQTIEQHYRGLVAVGEVWNSRLNRRISGAAFASFIADIAAYDALAANIQTLWTTQATTAGMSDYTRGDLTIEAGKQAYMVQRAAAQDGYGTFDADVPQTFTTS